MKTATAEPETREAPRQSATARIRGLFHAARPKQWSKNVLVVVAPAAAGVLGQGWAIVDTVLAFAAFCLAASGTYLINDARDVHADRTHPRKRFRPIAAGLVFPRTAYVVGALALIASLGVAALTMSVTLPVVVLVYVCLTTSYSLWLKHIVILDMVGVAAGFVLRAIAGAAAVQVGVSSWFLIVACLGSLFIVSAKRDAELRSSPSTRATLSLYTPTFLLYVRAMTSGALLVSYCLWALDQHTGPSAVAFGLSIVPFAVGILRYAMLVDRGEGEVPEELFLRDRLLLGSGLLVGVALVIGVYVV